MIIHLHVSDVWDTLYLELFLGRQLTFQGVYFNQFDSVFLFPDSLYFRGGPVAEGRKMWGGKGEKLSGH